MISDRRQFDLDQLGQLIQNGINTMGSGFPVHQVVKVEALKSELKRKDVIHKKYYFGPYTLTPAGVRPRPLLRTDNSVGS